MTLDEHIKKAEQDAVQAESDSDWGFGNFFIDRTEAIAYAKECRQLAEWLKELKQIRNALDMIRAEILKMRNEHRSRSVDYESISLFAEGLDKALRIIDKYMEGGEDMINFSKNQQKIVDALEVINNAHWVDNHNGTISCSHCHTWFYKDDRYSYMRHCPYCNVKMAESEDKE